jgi:hypothetical protein
MAASKEKEAVNKVLKSENFTPTTVIEGPSNSVWLVSVRLLGPNIEQVVVNLHGKAVKVRMATYRRTAQGWQESDLSSAGVADLQRTIENEVGKEK